MKLPRARHRWDVTPAQGLRLQERLAPQIRHTPLPAAPRLVAGGDATYSVDGNQVVAGWVVWDWKQRVVVECALAVLPLRFPYVPGLLSFREAPALIAAVRKLKVEPDVFMFDGQGVAHPRRFGLASHVGLLIDRPSFGCAKRRLCGTAVPRRGALADAVGAWCPLVHEGEEIGRVVRTRVGVKPVYVSVGHRITLPEAVRLALRCCTKYRLPEPSRLAHQFVTRRRNELRP